MIICGFAMLIPFPIQAGYISAQGRRLAETPAYEPWSDEVEPNNPSFMPGQHEFAVKIRPNDMPTNEEAAEMFSIFFNHIHPYIPIVNKTAFCRLWDTQREQISPLLLETIFACAGRLTTQPQKGLKWIAMATSLQIPCSVYPKIANLISCRTLRLFS
jgi:hypothetical protein